MPTAHRPVHVCLCAVGFAKRECKANEEPCSEFDPEITRLHKYKEGTYSEVYQLSEPASCLFC
jgi:hypothetical protein